MTFKDKLKKLRKEAKLTQQELADILGITKRSIINYELGKSFPRDSGVYNKIAKHFNVTTDYLISEQEEFIANAYKEGGAKEKYKAEALIAETSALFAGGELSQDDKDAVMMALQKAYWIAKEDNKKYSPKSSD
jgi:transcriptional regulator with XRE-family HTH domain